MENQQPTEEQRETHAVSATRELRPWLITALALAVTAVVVGGGMWWWMNGKLTAQQQEFKQEIESLEAQTEGVADMATNEDMSTWNVYSNEQYGFAISYPPDWQEPYFDDYDDIDSYPFNITNDWELYLGPRKNDCYASRGLCYDFYLNGFGGDHKNELFNEIRTRTNNEEGVRIISDSSETGRRTLVYEESVLCNGDMIWKKRAILSSRSKLLQLSESCDDDKLRAISSFYQLLSGIIFTD